MSTYCRSNKHHEQRADCLKDSDGGHWCHKEVRHRVEHYNRNCIIDNRLSITMYNFHIRMFYISIESIGSTERAPNTASVETGSVAAMSDPKMKHSITENSIPSKKWKWKVTANRIANYYKIRILIIGNSRFNSVHTGHNSTEQRSNNCINQNCTDILKEDSLGFHIISTLEDNDGKEE